MILKKNTIYKVLIVCLSINFGLSDVVWVKYGWEIFEYVTDARTAALGSSSLAYRFNSPSESLINPILSNNSQNISITHQSRFAGMINIDLIGFFIKSKVRNLNFNLLYEGIGDIPDTRAMLLDWGNDGKFGTNDQGEGNGVLDEGERLDTDKLRFFNQHQLGIHTSFNHSINNLPLGIGIKVLSYTLDDNYALGIGLDIGILRKIKGFNFGLVTRNIPASGLIWNNGTIETSSPSLSFGVHYPLALRNLPLKINSMYMIEISTAKKHLDSQSTLGPLSIDGSSGLEIVIIDKLYFRLGHNVLNNFTGGVGIYWDGFNLDYAFLTSTLVDHLGNNHLITLNIKTAWLKQQLQKL